MTTKLKRITPRTRYWRAWAGSDDQFRRLCEEIEKVIAPRRDALMLEWDTQNPPRAEGDTMAGYWANRREERLLTVGANARLWQDGDVIEGPLSEVLAELDPHTFEMMSVGTVLGSEVRDHTAIVAVMRKRYFKGEKGQGISVDVKSNDRDWSLSAFARISAEIEKRVPKWAFVRSLFFSWLAQSSFYALLLFISILLTSSSSRTLGLIVTVIIIVVTQLAIAWFDVWDWLFPPVEISHTGASSSWTRLSFALATLLSLPIGVLGNYIYSALTKGG